MPNGYVFVDKGARILTSRASARMGKGSGLFPLSGNLFTYGSATGVGNGAGTTEDTLSTYSLPPNSFDATGRCLNIYAWGSFAANANNKTAKLDFGAMVISTGVLTSSNVGWCLELMLIRTGTNTQIGNGQIIYGATHGGVTLPLSGTEVDTAAIVIKATGQSGTATANNIVLTGLIIDAFN